MRGERAFVVESCRCISMQPGIFITDREIGRDRCSYPCSTLEEADWISDWNRIPARPRLGSELRVNNNRWKIRGGWRSRRTIERLEVTSQFILGKISNELSSLVYLPQDRKIVLIPEIIRPIVACKFRGSSFELLQTYRVTIILCSRKMLSKFEKILPFSKFSFYIIFLFFLSLFLPSVWKNFGRGKFFFPFFFFLNVPFRTNYLDWRD